MISFFRSIFSSKIGLFLTMAFVALIAVAFATADVGGSGTFGGVTDSSIAATVGDGEIGNGELSQSVNNAFRTVQRDNPGLDIRAFVNQGGLDDTLDKLINSFALDVFGKDHGLAAGKRLVDSEIVKIPAFQAANGEFDQDIFRRALQQQGLNEKQIRGDFARNLIAEQLLTPVGFAAVIPKKLATSYASLLLEGRKGRVAAVPSTVFLSQENPGQAALSAFYSKNANRYTIPERRSISYTIFGKDRFAADAKATDAEIKEYYDGNSDLYGANETRNLVQVILPTEAAAKALLDTVKGGASLENAASQAGLSAATINKVAKTDYTRNTSKDVADAVFAATGGTTVEPKRSGLGWHVVQVSGVDAVAEKSMESVRAEIEALLIKDKINQTASDFTVRLEDEFSNGATLADVAAAEKLKIETTPKLLASGQNPDDQNYRPVEAMQRILPIAYTMEEDGDPQLIEIVPNEQFAVVDVIDIEPSAPPPLSQISALVLRDYQLSKASSKAKTLADEIVKKVSAGTSVAKAVSEAGVRLPAPQAIGGTRAQLAQSGQNIPPALTLMFSMAAKTAKTIAAPGDQGWLIVYLDEIDSGNAEEQAGLVEATMGQFKQVIGQEYSEQFISAIKSELGVEKNDAAVRALRQRLTGASQGSQ